MISSFHDTPLAGHPGIANTFAIVQQHYLWPSMRKTVEEYIQGCAQCQANKVNTHKPRPPLFHITTDPEAQPFEVVAMDFITKLPPSDGFDLILTITDHDCSKAAIFIPSREAIDSPGMAELHVKHVVPRYGIP